MDVRLLGALGALRTTDASWGGVVTEIFQSSSDDPNRQQSLRSPGLPHLVFSEMVQRSNLANTLSVTAKDGDLNSTHTRKREGTNNLCKQCLLSWCSWHLGVLFLQDFCPLCSS